MSGAMDAAGGSAPDCAGRNVAQWTYEAEETSDGYVHTAYDECGWRLTETYISEANAHLIAAAPDLLEALREAEAVVDALDRSGYSQSDVLAIVRAAIAKAEGRTNA